MKINAYSRDFKKELSRCGGSKNVCAVYCVLHYVSELLKVRKHRFPRGQAQKTESDQILRGHWIYKQREPLVGTSAFQHESRQRGHCGLRAAMNMGSLEKLLKIARKPWYNETIPGGSRGTI